MKKRFFKGSFAVLIFAMVLGLFLTTGSARVYASTAEEENAKSQIASSSDVDEKLESQLIDTYFGYYKGNGQELASQFADMIEDRELSERFGSMILDLSLCIDKDGSAVVGTTVEINSFRVKSEVDMEIVDVTENAISFKLKGSEDDKVMELTREEKDGKQYLATEELGCKYYFEKIEE